MSDKINYNIKSIGVYLVEPNNRVLFVDDDQGFLNSVVRSLRGKFDVTTCLAPKEALVMSREKMPFAVIVSDYRMPELDGIQYLNLMKQAFPSSERILLTGYPAIDVAVNAVNSAKVHSILLKPCSMDIVEAEIQSAMQKYNATCLEKEIHWTALDKLNSQIKQTMFTINREVQERSEDLQRLVALLRKVLAAKDLYTLIHSVRVSDLAVSIMKKLNYSEAAVHFTAIAGLLHDIGKIYVPSELLCKTDRLKSSELELVRYHVQAGYDLLSTVKIEPVILNAIFQHHERLNGSGYPLQIKGAAIIDEAQVIAVADMVEATANDRPYRPGLGIDFALRELEKCSDITFRKNIVDACISLFVDDQYRFDIEDSYGVSRQYKTVNSLR